ncbi:MAG: NAD(P)H-dependent oxidoreductase [Bacteroidales bacterium]|nr:NAD(P)H-dependent oxidoreductase [Bacteroidales bacterium]
MAGEKAETAGKKMLVVYYSWGGNTRVIAEQIKALTGADIFEIEAREAYSSDYRTVVDQAKAEIQKGEVHAIKAMPANLADYDVVFVGTPNWWSTMAPTVAAFLKEGDLAGKTVVPFVTHGGGGMARCEADIVKMCEGAQTLKGFAVNGDAVESAGPGVRKWLQSIGIIK